MAETPFKNAGGQSYVQNYDFTPYASIRTLPVQDWVQQAISNAVYAADPNLQIRVQSGGQTASRDPRLKNAPGGWTGSPRHDEGGAADFSLVRNGEKLPVRGNEELYQAVARNLAAQGVPGIGVDVSKGYIHAGGGSQASWGYQGNSASSRYLPQSFAAAINEGRQLYSRGTGIPTPPGEIPNVVASQVDTTPQTRNVPLPQPRPAQRMMQGTGQPPTSAASRAVPTMSATPRLAPAQDGVFAYTPPDMQPAQITPGMGSLTPDFFKAQPQVRLPNIGSASSPIGPGPTSLASVQDMYGRPQSRMDPIGAGPTSLATVQDMYGGRPVSRADPIGPGPSKTFLEDMMGVTMGGVGKPPATRSVPSIPIRPQIDPIGAMPSFADFQSQMGRGIPGPNYGPKDQARLTPGIYPMAPGGPAVASALSVVPNVPMPRPRPLRTLANVAMPTPMGQRPTLPTAPMQSPLRVTVQGANSYNAPQPQYVSTTGQALTPRQTVRYNPDTNTFAPVTLYEPKRQERRPSLPSGPAQSLV